MTKKNKLTRAAKLALATTLALAMGISLHAQTSTSTTTTAPTTTSAGDKPKVEITGFFKADFIHSNNAVMSYASESLVGQTHAKRQTQADDRNSRWGITPNQSRVSLKGNFSDKVIGYIETDLNGAIGTPISGTGVAQTQATAPGLGATIRIRQAYIEYKPTSKLNIFMGQARDVFSSYDPHTYNATVALFTGGNIAFVRNQIGVGFAINEMMSIKAAVGMPSGLGNNTMAPTLGNELNSTPTYAAAFEFKPMQNLKLNLSTIYADVKVRQTNIDNAFMGGNWLGYDINKSCVNRTAGSVTSTNGTNYPDNIMGSPNCGTQTFAQSWAVGHEGAQRMKANGYSFGLDFDAIPKKLSIKMEYTQGQNLGTLGAMSIASVNTTTYGNQWLVNNPSVFATGDNRNLLGKMFGNDARPLYNSIKEQSAWFSWNFVVTPSFQFGTHHSVTKIMNPEDLTPTAVLPNSPLTSATMTGAAAGASKWGTSTADTISSSFAGGQIREGQTHGWRAAYKPADTGGLTLFIQHDYHKTFYAERKSEQGINGWIGGIDVDQTTNNIYGRASDSEFFKSTGYSNLDMYSHHRPSAKAEAHAVRLGMMLPF